MKMSGEPYFPALGRWVNSGGDEYWAPVGAASPQKVVTSSGIGLAWGYQLNLPGETLFPNSNLYAAILAPPTAGQSPIVLARLDAQETLLNLPLFGLKVDVLQSNWVPLSSIASQIPANALNVVQTRIGLGFRPDNPSAADPKPGRFYVTWQFNAGNVGGTCYENQPEFAVSRGNYYSDAQNVSNTPQGLVFDRSGKVGNEWTSWASGASLVYFQGNVRGAYQTGPSFARACASPPVVYDPMSSPKTGFFPNIDGIFDYDEYDHDDVSYIKSHLSWALKQ
jgi:hypothetical protein